MLFDLNESNGGIKIGNKYIRKSASEIGIKEKAVENWIADNPQIIFPNEEVLIIGQSISGKSMADVLALDTSGNLVIVEIKRNWSDRATVGQLLEYASKFKNVSYDRLAEEVKKYDKWSNGELYNAFLNFIDRDNFPKENLGKEQRVIIVAPDADSGLKNIIKWLKDYGVPIEFVPFHIFVDEKENPKLFMVEGVTSSPELSNTEEEWAGHWIFNTNESNDPGAYKKMFKRDVAAIWGYESGSKTLEGSNPGDVVLAYVNGQGIRGLGKVVNEEVNEGKGIFIDDNGKQRPDEYHLSVKWEVLLSEEEALISSEAAEMGYNLPVRVTFGKLHKGQTAMKIENTIRKRKNSNGRHSA